jgi:hypothetical protein
MIMNMKLSISISMNTNMNMNMDMEMDRDMDMYFLQKWTNCNWTGELPIQYCTVLTNHGYKTTKIYCEDTVAS